MGHLTIITNQIIENMEKGTNSERIRQFIEGNLIHAFICKK